MSFRSKEGDIIPLVSFDTVWVALKRHRFHLIPVFLLVCSVIVFYTCQVKERPTCCLFILSLSSLVSFAEA